mgnify:CR=1 FL=1
MKAGRFGILVAGALAVGILILSVFFSSVAGEVVYPVERAASLFRRSVWSRVKGVFDASSCAAENVRLKREVAALSLLRGDCERLGVENARLRRALDYRARFPGVWEPAAVLSSGGGAAAVRHSIRVDRGSLSGVREGAVVVVPEGLVGRVSTVSPHTAEVALLTDPSVRVSCTVESSDGAAHGILSGGGADSLLLGHLRDAGALRPRSRVVTSGLGGVFPGGIEIGTLLLVTNGVRGVEGEVLPRVDYSTLEDVFIRRDQ